MPYRSTAAPKLDATELLESAMFEADRGTLESFCEESSLDAEDVAALAYVHAIWRRWITQGTSRNLTMAVSVRQRKAAQDDAAGGQD